MRLASNDYVEHRLGDFQIVRRNHVSSSLAPNSGWTIR
jgi:hypothetical protein